MSESGAAEDVRVVPDAVVGLTLDGIITSWNPSAERLYGYREAEIVGCPSEVLLPADRFAEEADALADVAAGQHVPHHITDRLCKDGTAVVVSLSMSPIVDGGGQIVGAAVVSHPVATGGRYDPADDDTATAVADRHMLDAHLQRGQRLENLQQLAGGVAHDFNNLLAVILNYSGFVAEELDTLLENDRSGPWAAIRRDMEQVQRAAERATTLTHQLLAFSRRDVIQPRVLDLNESVRAVADILDRTLGDQIEFRVEMAGELWPVVADQGQMELVLVNLALNARDAMPGGGHLVVETTNVAIGPEATRGSAAPPGHYACLRVRDTGRGMSDDVISRAMDPFFTTKGEGGAGLGLTTVHGIVTHADGHIQINSAPGVGTTVSILLPATDQVPDETIPDQADLATAGPQQSTQDRAFAPTPAGQTLLVVEDNEALREVTERIFARNGFRVLTAATGAEALELARGFDEEIHLLVTDVVMPHMSGREVADQLRDLKPGIEVLYMSGYAQPGPDAGVQLEPDAVLVDKPFAEADLLAKAAEALSRSAPSGA
jgi:PAS domain S-box-containing protein